VLQGVCWSGFGQVAFSFVLFYIFYFEKIRVFKAGQLCPLNILAWDDRKRQISFLFGFSEKI